MAHLHHFAYGWVTPVVAYLFSFLGCFLGLKATDRARIETSSGVKARWLLLAAWAIGGTGIWVMHFLAMTGFEVVGSQVTTRRTFFAVGLNFLRRSKDQGNPHSDNGTSPLVLAF